MIDLRWASKLGWHTNCITKLSEKFVVFVPSRVKSLNAVNFASWSVKQLRYPDAPTKKRKSGSNCDILLKYGELFRDCYVLYLNEFIMLEET